MQILICNLRKAFYIFVPIVGTHKIKYAKSNMQHVKLHNFSVVDISETEVGQTSTSTCRF